MRSDKISSLWGILLGLYTSKESVGLDLGSIRHPGSGFFPFIGGTLLVCFSAMLFFQSILPKSRMDKKMPREKENWRLVVYPLLGLVAYVSVFESLGFILSTFLLVFFLLVLFERKKYWVEILTAATVSLSSYIIFSILLRSDLPKGILGGF